VASYRDITDRKRAQNAAAQRSKELARSNAFLTALGHVGARVASTRDLDEVMQTLGTELKELEVLALVATLEADEHALCVRYTSIESPLLALGEKAVGHNMLGFRITPDNFPEWNTVVERREAALVPDPVSLVTRSLPHVMRATVERVFQLGGWTADVPAIWLPLAIGQRVIGALATWGSDLRESDVPALSVFASQVAVAVENARLYAAEREQAEELRRTNQFILTLSQVAARLAGTSEPDQVMETLGAALKMLGLDCVIGILDADDQDVVIRYASMDSGALSLAERLVGFQLVGYRLRRELWSASDVVEDRRPLFAAEPLEATAALLPNIPRAVLERAMRVAGVAPDSKVIYLPLMIGDHVSGVMAVWGPNLRQEDMAPLSVFAGQVAAALANARLLTEQKQRTADLAHAGALLRTELAEREQAEAARRESRMRLRSILDANPDLVYLTDAVGTLLDANAALLKVLGLPLEQAQGRNALEFLVGEGRERIEQAADRLRAGEEVRGLELQARVASGEVRYYEVHAVPRTHEGTVAEIVNVARDITDRKQAEEALRASNELLTKVFSTTHLLIAYMDADFNFIRVNRAYAAADGREPESFEGKNHFDLYPSEENEAIFRGVVETGEPASFRAKPFEYAEHPERGLTHWDWDLVPVKDAQGAVQGLVLSLVDVTQRIQAEQELREERDFAQTLIGTAQAIVLVLDTQGRVVQFNPYLEEISGYSLEEVQGKDWFSTFLPARDQDWVRELFVQAVGDIQTLGNVNAMVTKDGQERQIEWYDKTLKDAKGNVVGLLAIGQDVTERRQAQAALQEMHTQLEQRVAERTRELATLYDVTALASESLDLKVTLQRSLERLLAAMPCSCGVLHLLDRAEGLLRLAAQQGLSSGLAAQLATLPAETGVLGSTLEQGQPLVISDLAAHALGEIAPAVREFTICVAAPVRARGTSVGLLHVFGRADEECSLEDLALLTSVADHVGIAVDNAWLQQRAEQAAVLEERERLGRELHDSITQALFGLSLYAELASDLLDSGEWERAAEELARIQVAAQQVLKDTRLLIYRMRPVLLEEEGLVEALRHRVAAVEGRAGIEARVVSEAVGDLPARLEEAFYYIAQEALNNAFRHAQASSVTVSVRGEGEHLLLEVADNGRGFDLDAVQALGGMGLGNMRQRAEQLGGTLAILSEPGRGTTVRAKVSLAAHTDPAQANHSRQTTKRRQGRD
jgi:PAS domain S-box-containing protein